MSEAVELGVHEVGASYLIKAEESLEGAESEFANGRYGNSANRSYYACYQAAIYALLTLIGERPKADDLWRHGYVQAQFVGELINRRKRLPVDLRRTLAQNLSLRHQADYEAQAITETQAERASTASYQGFYRGCASKWRCNKMTVEAALDLDERVSNALEELKSLILAGYPEATFDVVEGEDPDGIYLRATVDVEDIDEVMDVYVDRLLELQIDEGLDVYVTPLEPMERVTAKMRANPFVARPHRVTPDGKSAID